MLIIFLLKWFYSGTTVFYHVLYTLILHRSSLYSFLFEVLALNWPHPFNGFQTFFFQMHLKMSSAKWWPFCLGLSVFSYLCPVLLGISFAFDWLALSVAHAGGALNGGLRLDYSEKHSQPPWWYHQMDTFSALLAFVGESTGHWLIPITNASDAKLCCFLWSATEQTVEQTISTVVIWNAIALIMTLL